MERHGLASYLIGFVLAFLIGPWKLTFNQFAIVFLSSGIGALLGAYIWGWIADRIGRRPVPAVRSAPAVGLGGGFRP